MSATECSVVLLFRHNFFFSVKHSKHSRIYTAMGQRRHEFKLFSASCLVLQLRETSLFSPRFLPVDNSTNRRLTILTRLLFIQKIIIKRN